MRKQMLATLLISAYWIIAGFFVAYSAWERGFRYSGVIGAAGYPLALPDPYALGILLAIVGLVFSFIVIRALLPSRTSQRRKLLRLLDEVGIEEVEAIQRKLNTLSDDYHTETADRTASLESLLREEKRKNRA